jgi:Zn-finger nucleic acid-binding protein
MRCPIDETTLVMADRQGIEIDYCPQCRGVWLDRGELDKIIDRAAAEQTAPVAAPVAVPAAPAPVAAAPPPRREASYDDDDYDDDPRRKKKKSSMLGDLFDF